MWAECNTIRNSHGRIYKDVRWCPGKDQKGWTPLSQSSQKKVAHSSVDGEEAFMCVKVEVTRSKGKLKKSGTDGSTSNDRVVYSAV